eukprot:SAG31_NODE_2314_length_5953_cov_1.996413_2_plen_74_part_00
MWYARVGSQTIITVVNSCVYTHVRTATKFSRSTTLSAVDLPVHVVLVAKSKFVAQVLAALLHVVTRGEKAVRR